MKRFVIIGLGLLAVASNVIRAAAGEWVGTRPSPGSFPLAPAGSAAPIVFAAEDFKVVSIAANDLAADIERITGRKPAVRSDAQGLAAPAVFVGTLGHSAAIDELVRAGKLDVRDLRGAWESFIIAMVDRPLPGVPQALVIAGSDRRGTAFGVYELSQAIGVSPWHWWADVTPEKKPALFVAAGTRRFGPPSVKYRGIFINDEDWGLEPWSEKNFEPENGGMGPKTYARIFELMLRLKANTVWPGMHPTTKPFNFHPQNKVLADDYAIVMGSSHAEPMLRNNVGEWKDKPERYNYVTNRDGVLGYWEERMKENGRFENLYTLGMRGVHDSGIQGARTDAERIRVLEQTFVDQRDLIRRYVRPEVEQVPQMFCAYKEVLGLYRQGLKVPDDVTIVWPDDNHGYIRNYATDAERKRSGGFGVYYHLSYLGAPMAYLWLYTTPPALVWEEMTKAYDHGARTIWIANVGDLKPAEIGTEFFLQLAWDINRWNRDTLRDFLPQWAKREFPGDDAPEIANIMARYFALNYQRRPEHLQWWLPREAPKPSPLNTDEVNRRSTDFLELRARASKVAGRLPAERQDAFFELVGYPVAGSALANQRYFSGEQAALMAEPAGTRRNHAEMSAMAADQLLRQETEKFNTIAGGKWKGIMAMEPADDQWRSFRLTKWEIPKFASASPRPPLGANSGRGIALETERFVGQTDRGGAGWRVIPDLGRSGDSIAIFPTTMAGVAPEKIHTDAPRADYRANFPAAGKFNVTVYLVPTQPIRAGRGLRFALGLDDQPPQEVVANVRDGSPEWAQSVLNAAIAAQATLEVPAAGPHTVQLYGVDPGVVIDKIVIDLGGLLPSYLGPLEMGAGR